MGREVRLEAAGRGRVCEGHESWGKGGKGHEGGAAGKGGGTGGEGVKAGGSRRGRGWECGVGSEGYERGTAGGHTQMQVARQLKGHKAVRPFPRCPLKPV